MQKYMRHPAKITHSIGEYVRRNEERKNVYWIIRDGIEKFYMDGFFYHKDDFDYFYPKMQYKPFNEKGQSPGKCYDK